MMHCLMVALATLILISNPQANTPQAPMHLGRIWTNPEYDGTDGRDFSLLQYPGGIPNYSIYPEPTDFRPTLSWSKRGWIGQLKRAGSYLFTTDWQDPQGYVHAHLSSYRNINMDTTYPLVMKYPDSWLPSGQVSLYPFHYRDNYGITYPGGLQVYHRWERPRVMVDGRIVIHRSDPGPSSEVTFPDYAGVGSYPVDIVDPSLVSEQVVDSWWRYIPGVELRRRQYAYPYGSPHQDYITSDMTLTNNGICGVAPGADVLTGQTITGMIWGYTYFYNVQHSSDFHKTSDNDLIFIRPWGAGQHSASFMYDIDDDVSGEKPGPDWGDPVVVEGVSAELTSNAYVMIGPLFVSTGTNDGFALDLPDQPALRIAADERGIDISTNTMHSVGYPYPETPLQQREILLGGSRQFQIGKSFLESPDTPKLSDSFRYSTILGYGPVASESLSPETIDQHGWDLGWQESVRIVQMMAAGGIDQDEAQRIAAAWEERRLAGDPESSWMSPNDITLVQSGRDTAFKAAALAYWNYHGQFAPNVTNADLVSWGISNYASPKPAPYDQRYNVPDGPRPPGFFSVRALPNEWGGGVELRWTREAETVPDHDTGVDDFAGYRVWRQSGTRYARWELIYEGQNFRYGYAVDGLPEGLIHYDDQASPDSSYWYAVTTYDDGSQNWAQDGVSLESSRWWTWTGYDDEGVSPYSQGHDRLPPGGKVPSLSIPEVLCPPGKTIDVPVIATFDSIRALDIALTFDTNRLTPTDQTILKHAFKNKVGGQSIINVIGDTIRVSLISAETISLDDDTLVVLSFRPAGTVHDTLEVPIKVLSFPETHLGGSPCIIHPGAVQLLPVAYGDVSGNGTISSLDASLLLQYAARLISFIDLITGEVTGDGIVNSLDAAHVLIKALDSDYTLPIEQPAKPAIEITRNLSWSLGSGGWNLVVDDATDVASLDMTILVPQHSDAQPVSQNLVFRNEGDGRIRIAYARIPSGETHLMTVESTQELTESPLIETASMNEGRLVMHGVPTSAAVDEVVPFALHSAVPNPFNPRTTLRYSIPEAGMVRLSVLTLTGQLMRTIVDGEIAAGNHSISWEGRDNIGRLAASGVYIVRLEHTGSESNMSTQTVRRITLVR
jgi:hypothetical protein